MAGSFADALIRIRGDTSEANRALQRTHAQLRGLASPLRRIRDIAGGILLARAFQMGAQAAKWFVSESIKATETMQLLDLQIQSLAAREMANFITNAIEMSGAISYTAKGTEHWYIINEALRKNLGEYVDILPQISQELADVAANQRHGTRITKEQGAAWVTASEIYELAAERADMIGFQLKKIGVLSPYSIQAANDVMRLSLAFGFSTDQSLRMTQGMLDVAAGLGATTEQMNRMTFNFAQLRKQGKMQARDFWELGKAGFDLYAVLRKLSSITGQNIQDHHDFNRAMASGKITWEDFVTAFETMAREDFGGAAKRMAYSITGIKSMFKDVFLVTVPEYLKPAAELIGQYAETFSEKLLEMVESGELERRGQNIRNALQKVIEFFQQVGRMVDLQGWSGAIQTLMNVNLLSKDSGEKLKPYADALNNFWDALKKLGGIVWEVITEGLGAFASAFLGDDIQKIKNIKWHEVINDVATFIGNLGETLATHKDAIVEALETLGPAFRDLTTGISDLGGALLELTLSVIEDLLAIFKQSDPTTMDDAANAISNIGLTLSEVAQYIRDNKEELTTVISNVVVAFAAFKTLTGVSAMITGLSTALGSLTVSAGPLMILIVALSGLIMLLIEHREDIRNALTGWEKVEVPDIELPTIGAGTLGYEGVSITTPTIDYSEIASSVSAAGPGQIISAFEQVGEESGEAIVKSVNEQIFGAGGAGLGIQSYAHGTDIGGSMVNGVIEGVSKNQFELNQMMRNMAREALQAAEAELDIDSPSQVFAGIGANVVAGFVSGIQGTIGQVQAAVGDMATAATQTPIGATTAGKSTKISTDRSKNVNVDAGAINVTVGKEEDIFAATMAFEDALLTTLEDIT